MRRGFLDTATTTAPPQAMPRCAPREGDYQGVAKFMGFPSWTPGEPCEQFENMLVMLHGDLDGHFNFMQFGRLLNLPKTCLWSLGGALDKFGRAVYDEDDVFERRWMLSEEEGANLETRARHVAEASSKVRQALRVLRDERGWDLTRVHLFGFSDGGTVALDVAASMTGKERLGGCAVVAAAALEPQTYAPCDEAPTPVLLIAGTRDEVVSIERVRQTAAALLRRNHGCGAEVHEFDKTHGMTKSAPEVHALMKFWGQTYKYPASKASDFGDDVVEISSGAS